MWILFTSQLNNNLYSVYTNIQFYFLLIFLSMLRLQLWPAEIHTRKNCVITLLSKIILSVAFLYVTHRLLITLSLSLLFDSYLLLILSCGETIARYLPYKGAKPKQNLQPREVITSGGSHNNVVNFSSVFCIICRTAPIIATISIDKSCSNFSIGY